MLGKHKLQDMNRIIEINKEVARLENKIRVLRNEENKLWQRNDNKFELLEVK